jgi:hypothetical protein
LVGDPATLTATTSFPPPSSSSTVGIVVTVPPADFGPPPTMRKRGLLGSDFMRKAGCVAGATANLWCFVFAKPLVNQNDDWTYLGWLAGQGQLPLPGSSTPINQGGSSSNYDQSATPYLGVVMVVADPSDSTVYYYNYQVFQAPPSGGNGTQVSSTAHPTPR